MQIASPTTLIQAAAYLAEHDAVLRPIIADAGTCDIAPHGEYYRALTDEIIGQQLSVKAAASIRRRFYDLFGGSFPLPEKLLAKEPELLRSAGLSNAKVKYIRDLAQHVLDGRLKFDAFDRLSNEEIMRELVAVQGIGEWTAHMFLIFCMGRLDILPTGDLGIRNGIRKLYSLAELPTPVQIVGISEKNHWHPYESVASWYVWYSLDNKPMS